MRKNGLKKRGPDYDYAVGGWGLGAAKKKMLVAVAMLMIAISNIISSVKPPLKNDPKSLASPHHSPKQEMDIHTESSLQRFMHLQRRKFLNESSIIDLGLSIAQHDRVHSRFLQDFFGGIEVVESWKRKNASEQDSYAAYFADPSRGDLLYGRVCDTILVFRAAMGRRKHVLISSLNENWGAFSTPVPHRTVDWGEWEMHFTRDGCTKEDLWWHMMTGSQIDRVAREIHGRPTPNRTELLLIAQSHSPTREVIAERVIENFNGTIRNRYGDGTDYWEILRQSKFVLCPSGMGWDTYRAWEALCMGAIPVLETYYRKDGFYKIFDDLPVLWVEHYDNVTPSLLEEAYPPILLKAHKYNFEKLTKQWWVDLINHYRHSAVLVQGINFDVHKEDANNIQAKNHVSPQNSGEGLSESFDFPPTINICNVTTLSFDKDKMVLTGQSISIAHVPKNGTHFAYGPWITKSGSTSLINSLKFASDNAPSLDLNTANEEIFDKYDFLSVLRHPMDRALAGFHHIEVFWLHNWIDTPIDRLGLSWYNKTCLNNTWASDTKAKGKHQCIGSKPETTTQKRLRRLNDFLEEVEQKGFWDQHIAPMTYLIFSNRFRNHARYFDIKHIDRLTDIISTSAGKAPKPYFPFMKRGGLDQGMDWVIRRDELVTLAHDGETLAHSAIEKLCHLYHNDVMCFPYDIPECDKWRKKGRQSTKNY
ncbi:hypothetical protein ACHAWF_004038 [Thalassiosira exigua]